MTIRTIALLLLLPLCLAAATAVKPLPSGEQVREQHKEAARAYFAELAVGQKLSGSVSENGSPGTFTAWFIGDTWVVRQQFGDLVSMNYEGPNGSWVGSNYSLPYQTEPESHSASATLNMLTNGKYLQSPYWETFTYTDDVAGGYNFRFAPEGLPEATVVLYSDPAEPQFLQVMSAEIRLSPKDSDSHTYRSFYYYNVGTDGKLYTSRETGREIDGAGVTASFTEYTVEKVEPMKELPAEAQFKFEREPRSAPQISAPVDIPVDVGSGYFIVPITFAGSDKTWNFIFDTGASASLFTPEAAAAAGLTPSINVPAHGHGNRVDFQMGLCTTASIGRADAPADQRVPLSGFPAARVSESNRDVLKAFESYKAAGILGVAMLHQYVATFDNYSSKITLIPPAQFEATNIPRPNLEIWLDVEDLIYLIGYVSDNQRAEPLRGQVVLDTGLQQKLSLLEETVEASGLQFEKIDSRNNTVLGGVKRFDYVTVPRFDVAALTWQDVQASLTNDDKGTLSARGLLGFVGVPFFYGTRVTVDLFAQRVYVRPLEPEEQAGLQKMLEELKQSEAKPEAAVADGEAAEVPEDGADQSRPRSTADVDRDRFRDIETPDSDEQE
ncbi:MAG: aspartyl protease family protein [bacterium]|nr:aspartyl protease family protein [bacterium]